MAPLSAWLPPQLDAPSDVILTIAGEGIVGCSKGMQALERALMEQGFEILAQHGRLNGRNTSAAVRLRISSKPITSMGHGCDILAWLDEEVPQLSQFAVQPGSVLLCEPRVAAQLNALPVHTGMITYPIPFSDLTGQCGACFSGKGLVALGVLTHLLGLPPAALRHHLEPEYSRRYFDTGLTFALAHLRKRDVYALSAAVSNPGRVLLNVKEAMALGLSSGSCRCPASCLSTLEDAPDAWVARHVHEGASLMCPASDVGSIETYVGPCSGTTVLVGRENPSEFSPLQKAPWPIVLVASDIADLLALLLMAPRLRRETARLVWVIADGALTRRVQTVSTGLLRQLFEDHHTDQRNQPQEGALSLVRLRAEREGVMHADVGYVAWGSAQGVVREAIAICHGFGLNVAALYPKSLPPLSGADLEAFASTVAHVVVVESNAFSDYAGLVASTTSLRPSQVRPEPGRALTAMDMFLREGLGCQQTE
ncbi:MAG TPA: hypothetical protein VFI05_04660 [Nitrospiraceae bacterium]|nr:hypothetical protein [Nitrospiraceae bacterium]